MVVKAWTGPLGLEQEPCGPTAAQGRRVRRGFQASDKQIGHKCTRGTKLAKAPLYSIQFNSKNFICLEGQFRHGKQLVKTKIIQGCRAIQNMKYKLNRKYAIEKNANIRTYRT